MCVRWCEAYQLRQCHLGQMMAERGIEIDHSTAHRRAINLLPVMENACRRHQRSVGKNRRVNETRRHPWRTATARARRRRRNRLRRRALGRMGRLQPDERSPEPRGHGPRHGLAMCEQMQGTFAPRHIVIPCELIERSTVRRSP